MSKLYEIIVFTASQKSYADKVIDLIDPKKRIAHRLYRDHCIIINKSYYLKNMRILGRNLKNIIIVDVSFNIFRIVILLDYFSLIISIKFSPFRVIKKIGIYVDSQHFWSIFMIKGKWLQLETNDKGFNKWKLIYLKKIQILFSIMMK